MSKFFIFNSLLLLQVLLCVFTLADKTKTSCPSPPTHSPCGGPDSNWIAYKDEKCFKLIKTFATRDQAEALCSAEKFNSGIVSGTFPAYLASIKNEEEQQFLSNYLFNQLDIEINVWIGAARSKSEDEFTWPNGSPLKFTNWEDGKGPDSTDLRRNCALIQSGWEVFKLEEKLNSRPRSSLANQGKWATSTCATPKYVLCERLQAMSLEQLQESFLETRRSLLETIAEQRVELEATRKSLVETKQSLVGTQAKLDSVERNPVPIGFIYTQLSGQPDPFTIWPTLQWSEVSGDYAGQFFRVLGGNSAQFGTIQEENSPRLVGVRFLQLGANYDGEVIISANGEYNTGRLWSGSNYHTDINQFEGHQFKVSAGEVRPRNQAMRLWKRIG